MSTYPWGFTAGRRPRRVGAQRDGSKRAEHQAWLTLETSDVLVTVIVAVLTG